MTRLTTGLAFLGAGLLAAPLAAAEGGATGGPFEGNIGNALWTLIIFAVVVFVLGKFAWKPILAGLQQREQFIRTSLEQAKRDRDEAEARLREYSDKLTAARAEATAIVDEARNDAEAVRRRIEEEGRVEASAIVERARREVTIAAETAKKELFEVSARLATELAGRLLGREVNAADHERLIRDSIDRIEDGTN
jgi:F-type H+-transporting ATPase subunit b